MQGKTLYVFYNLSKGIRTRFSRVYVEEIYRILKVLDQPQGDRSNQKHIFATQAISTFSKCCKIYWYLNTIKCGAPTKFNFWSWITKLWLQRMTISLLPIILICREDCEFMGYKFRSLQIRGLIILKSSEVSSK